MMSWLRGHRERRKDYRRRMEVERDQRRLAELRAGVAQREERERRLIEELWRLERELQRISQ
jgi:predicted  nucleic acid-binding Zn-ribbon protein